MELINKKRVDNDIMQLIQCNYEVNIINVRELEVKFKGPAQSLYDRGTWKVRVSIPLNYPYKSPTVVFKNKILHPNIKEQTGVICMNVLQQSWTPVYSLKTIFDTFLPQLLRDPNPDDPLNLSAASLYKTNIELYNERVREYVVRYAIEKPVTTDSDSDSSELSDDSSISPELSHAIADEVVNDVVFVEDIDENALNLETEVETTASTVDTNNAISFGTLTVNSLIQLENIQELESNINDDELLIPVEGIGQITGEDVSAVTQASNNSVHLGSTYGADEDNATGTSVEILEAVANVDQLQSADEAPEVFDVIDLVSDEEE